MVREKRFVAAALFWAVLVAPVAAMPQPAAADVAKKPTASGTGPGRDSLFGDFSLRSRREPISVRADKLEFSYKERVLEYTGQVVVTQGDLTLKADALRVTINENTRDQPQKDQLQEITATGNVEIAQGKRSAAGGKAVFNQQDRTIVLSEGAVLMEGANKISGDKVIVYLDEERSVVEGGEKRVQALLYPGEDLGKLGHEGEAGKP